MRSVAACNRQKPIFHRKRARLRCISGAPFIRWRVGFYDPYSIIVTKKMTTPSARSAMMMSTAGPAASFNARINSLSIRAKVS